MGDVPLGPAPALPTPLALPQLDAIRGQEDSRDVYSSLRSLLDQQNAVVAYLRNSSGRGAKNQSAGPFLASGRPTACSITLYWQTRGDGFAPQFYQVWRADAGDVGTPTSPTFDQAEHAARMPAELNTPFITRSRYIWADNDFTSAEVVAGVRRAYWITAIDVSGNESLPVAIGPLSPGICGGSASSNEILIIADTSVADQAVTLPDPASLPPKTIINVKNWNSGGFELHILPGVGLTIDGLPDGIRTRTDNQGYRFRYGPSADEGTAAGWVCIETIWGGVSGGASTGGPPQGTPGIVACSDAVPDWIADPTFASDYQVLTAVSGTYTKPIIPGARFVGVVGFGGGGGAGTADGGDANDAQGGGLAGGGGARKIQIYDYDTFPASVLYSVNQGGLGGVQVDIPPALVGHRSNPGQDGGPSWLGADDPGALFWVGGGKGALAGSSSLTGVGAPGGSWDQNGSTLGTNANGAEGQGAGGESNDSVHTYGSPTSCAECGGAGGAGRPSATDSGPGPGGSSKHGGAGGGMGGSVNIAPTVIMQPSAGGAHGAAQGGGGAAGVDPGDAGADGAAGVDLDGGDGGGGGRGITGPIGGTSGRGGDGGIPGGGGGGSGAPLVGGARHVGRGGNGARGELRVYVI